MKRNRDHDGEQVDGVKTSDAGHEKLVQVARALKVVLVGVVQDEAGEHEEEGDAEVAMLKKDSDGARHVGACGKSSTEVEGHDPDCREESYSGESVQASAAYAFAGGWNQAFLKQLERGHWAKYICRSATPRIRSN